MKYLPALLLVHLLSLPVPAAGSLADTVGWTGGCTCVVVHRDGWALTAEHCEHQDAIDVQIAGRSVKARKVFEPEKNGTDEAVLLKLEGGPFAWATVSAVPVRRGDTVHSWGFPAGKLSYISGAVNMVAADGSITGDFAAIGGHSGAPLFNASGQVCGLLSTSDRATVTGWIGLPSIQRAMQYAQGGQPVEQQDNADRLVWVLTSAGCLPCANLKADYQRGQFPGIEMRFIDASTPEGRQLRDRIAQSTGRTPEFTPTLWADGGNTFTTGYTGIGTLRSWLGTIFRLPQTTWEMISGDRERGLQPEPPRLIEGEPKPSPEPDGMVPLPPGRTADEEWPEHDEPSDPDSLDFTGVRLLLFAPIKADGLVGDAAARAALALADAAGNQVREATDDKAVFVLVSERLTPARYAATCEASGVVPGEFHLLAMVPAQSGGIRQRIRARLASVAKEQLPESIRDAPVGLLSETVSEEPYHATLEALSVAEPTEEPGEGGDPVSPTEGGSPLMVLVFSLIGLVEKLLTGRK